MHGFSDKEYHKCVTSASPICSTLVRRECATAISETERHGSGYPLVLTSHALNHSYDSLLPVLYPYMISEFHLTYGAVGMLVMGFKMSSGALQLLMGYLGRFVPRKALLGIGMIWQSTFNMFASFSSGFDQIFSFRTMAGVGASPQHPTGASYISDQFPKERLGRALGANIVAGQLGSFLTPVLAGYVLTFLRWRETMLLFSIPGILVGAAFLFIRRSKRFTAGRVRSGMSLLNETRRLLRDKVMLAIVAAEAVMAFRMGAGEFLPSYFVKNLGMTTIDASVLFAVFLSAGIPSPYFWGHLSDKFQRRKIVMLAMGIACFMWFLLPYGEGILQLLPILLLLGFVSVGTGGVVQAFAAENTSPQNRDLVYGVYFTLAFTLGGISPVVIGYLADSLGFQIGFLYVALVSLLALIAASFLR